MILNEQTVQLISELEYLVGHQCFNPKSYNGYTGDEGCTFRYPISYTNKNNVERKTKLKISDADEESIRTMCYKFGSNHLYIGDALVRILNHIEEQCGININKLLTQNKKVKK